MIVSWIMLLAMIVVNALAQTGVLTTNAVRNNSVFTWFEPEQYVQLIWIPIYALLAIWLIRVQRSRHRAQKVGHTPFSLISITFILACAADIGWILAWVFVNYPAAVTLVIVQTILVGITWFMNRRRDTSFMNTAPFILWGTWMLVETITDCARAITYYVSKDGTISFFAQAVSTVVLVTLLLVAAWFANNYMHDWLFGIVVLWSVIGIAFRLMGTSRLTAGVIIALAAAGAVLTYVPWQQLANRMPQSTHTSPAQEATTSVTPPATHPHTDDAYTTDHTDESASPLSEPSTDNTDNTREDTQSHA